MPRWPNYQRRSAQDGEVGGGTPSRGTNLLALKKPRVHAQLSRWRSMNYWLIPTLLLALILFGVGILLVRRLENRLQFWLLGSAGVLASVPAVVFAVYYLRVFSEPLWLYQFRAWPSTELTAGGAGFLAGLLHGRYSSKPQFRRVAGRWFFPGALLLGLLVPYAKPILRPPRWSEFQERWSQGVCLQTSESSCGPACASTLLRQLGKTATEKEIAQASFTSRSGTENWYLARSLRQRGIRVRFCLNRDPNKPWPVPSIAGVRLSSFGNSGHFITILDRADDNFVIGDPLEGRLVLSKSALLESYTFTGFFLQLD